MALVNGSLKTDDDETFIFAKLLSDQSANLHKEPNGRKWSDTGVISEPQLTSEAATKVEFGC